MIFLNAFASLFSQHGYSCFIFVIYYLQRTMCSSVFTKQQMFQVSARKAQDLWSKGCGVFWNLLECYITEQPAEKFPGQPSPLLLNKPTRAQPFYRKALIHLPWFPFFQHSRADVSITIWYPSPTWVQVLICPYSWNLNW